MKKILFFTFLVLCVIAYPENRYVKSLGSDSNAGTSDALAWQTLSHVQEKIIDGTIIAGDTIFINRGDTIHGARIDIDKTITFKGYGTGNKPVISGMIEISGFTQLNSSTWYKILTTGIKQEFLLFDGIIKDRGLWTLNSTWRSDVNRLESADMSDEANTTATSPLIKAAYQIAGDLSGSKIVINLVDWAIGVHEIKSMPNDSTVIFDGTTTDYDPNGGTYGDYHGIQDNWKLFDENGQWGQHEDTLFIRCTDDPANHIISISDVDTLFTLEGGETMQDFLVQGIDIYGINYFVADVDNTNFNTWDVGHYPYMNWWLDSVNVRYATRFATGSISSDYVKITNCDVQDVFGIIFRLYGPPDTFLISDNNFKNTGKIIGYDTRNQYGYNGIICMGGANDAAIIRRNRIDSAGYNGFSIGSDIYNNYVTNTNLILPDGAGFHLGNTGDTIYLHDNIFEYAGRGMYADYGVNYYIAINNYVKGNSYGIYGNDVKYSRFHDNVLEELSTAIRLVSWMDSIDKGFMHDDIVSRNIILNPSYSTFTNTAANYDYGATDWATIGWSGISYLDSNYYYGNNLSGKFKAGNSYLYESYDFDTWQAAGYDVHSIMSETTDYQVRKNTDIYSPLIISFPDSIYYEPDGTVHIGGDTLPPTNVRVYITGESISNNPTPSGTINSILGGYYGGYINGGYYGGSIIGTKQE